MDEIRKLRLRYNNEWPTRLLFPAEEELRRKFDRNNIQQVFVPAGLDHSEDPAFHSLLSQLLESLDQLPFRPDLAFDFLWRALDAEFTKIKNNPAIAHTYLGLMLSSPRLPPSQALAPLFTA